MSKKLAAALVVGVAFCGGFALKGGYFNILWQPVTAVSLVLMTLGICAFRTGFRATYRNLIGSRSVAADGQELFIGALASTHLIAIGDLLYIFAHLTLGLMVVVHCISVLIVGYFYGIVWMALIPAKEGDATSRILGIVSCAVPAILLGAFVVAKTV